MKTFDDPPLPPRARDGTTEGVEIPSLDPPWHRALRLMKPPLLALVIGLAGTQANAVSLDDESVAPIPAAAHDADNTARNVSDAKGRKLTPLDQGTSEADINITKDIRAALVGDERLSTNAHNVKVITVDQVVTLRGPVKSSQEKTVIASIAAKTAGVKRVDDQLEIEAQP